MKQIKNGIICRICKHNKDGVCDKGYTEGIDKKDDCWTFQHKGEQSGLATYSEVSLD